MTSLDPRTQERNKGATDGAVFQGPELRYPGNVRYTSGCLSGVIVPDLLFSAIVKTCR